MVYIGFINGGSTFCGVNIYGLQPLLAGGLGVLPPENVEI